MDKYVEGKSYVIDSIIVKGLKTFSNQTVISYSGLRKGQKIQIPGEEISFVISKLWKLDLFSDINFYVKNVKDNLFSLKQIPKANGSIVVLNPYNGRVLAMSGGFSFKLSEFNRATQALRQPGSAFKPFIYTLALENNFTPSSLVLDAPIVLDQGEDLKMWKPENYGKKFYGPSTIRICLLYTSPSPRDS